MCGEGIYVIPMYTLQESLTNQASQPSGHRPSTFLHDKLSRQWHSVLQSIPNLLYGHAETRTKKTVTFTI